MGGERGRALGEGLSAGHVVYASRSKGPREVTWRRGRHPGEEAHFCPASVDTRGLSATDEESRGVSAEGRLRLRGLQFRGPYKQSLLEGKGWAFGVPDPSYIRTAQLNISPPPWGLHFWGPWDMEEERPDASSVVLHTTFHLNTHMRKPKPKTWESNSSGFEAPRA